MNTGAVTNTGWNNLGRGEDIRASSLEYNPDDGWLYHFYTVQDGYGGDRDRVYLERIDPNSGTVEHVGTLTLLIDRILSVAYAQDGWFYAVDDDDVILQVSTSGVARGVSHIFNPLFPIDSTGKVRGLEVVVDNSLVATVQNSEARLLKKLKKLKKRLKRFKKFDTRKARRIQLLIRRLENRLKPFGV